MAVLDEATLLNWFTWHDMSPEDISKSSEIRLAALEFAKVVVANTPASADQSAAIRKIREAAATANLAIACGGV
jgi:hypothetical protein